jgi:hypothetical protein
MLTLASDNSFYCTTSRRQSLCVEKTHEIPLHACVRPLMVSFLLNVPPSLRQNAVNVIYLVAQGDDGIDSILWQTLGRKVYFFVYHYLTRMLKILA